MIGDLDHGTAAGDDGIGGERGMRGGRRRRGAESWSAHYRPQRPDHQGGRTPRPPCFASMGRCSGSMERSLPGPIGGSMIVEFNVRDFLDRAEVAYPERVGLIDEPDQPAEPWAPLTFAEMADRARSQAAGLDRLGIGPGERVADRLPQRLAPAHLVLRSVRMGSHPGADQLPPGSGRGGVHRRALRRLGAPGRPGARRPTCPASGPRHRFVLGRRQRRDPLPGRRRTRCRGRRTSGPPPPSTTRREPRPGPRACSSPTGTAGSTPRSSAGTSSSPISDVYLHTLPMFHANGWGMPWSTAAMGCTQVVLRKVDGTEILRRVERHGVTLLCAAPAVVNAVLDALPRVGPTHPGPGSHPHRGGRRTAAQPDHRTGRVRARVGSSSRSTG